MLMFEVLILIYTTIGLGLYLIVIKNKMDMFTSIPVILFYSLFYLQGYILKYQTLSYIDIKIYLIAVTFIIFFIIGSYGKTIKKETTIDFYRLKITGYIIYFFSIYLFLISFYKYGISFFLIGKGTRTLLYNSAGFEKFAKDIMIAGIIVLNFYFVRPKYIKRFMYKFIFVFSFLIFFLLENRSAIVIELYTFLYLYNRNIKHINNFLILIFLFSTIIMATLGNSLIYSFKIFLITSSFHINITNIIYESFIQHEFYAWFEIFKNLHNVFVGGETFLQTIKSFLWPHFLGGEHFSLTDWYAENYLPYELFKKGYGRGFSFLVELYINFGIVLTIIFGFLIGKIFKKLENSGYYIVSAFIVSVFPFFWTGQLALLFKQYLAIYFLMPFLIYQSLRLLPIKKKKYVRVY